MSPEYMSSPGAISESLDSFNLNAAFQSALADIVEDEALMLEQKVQRIEAVITESASDLYREFVDFRALAAQVELFCTHDHGLRQAVTSSEVLSGFLGGHADHDEHEHDHVNHVHTNTRKERKRTKTKAEVRNVSALLALIGSRSVLSFFGLDKRAKSKQIHRAA